jgi:hypothetical protein
MTVPPPIPQSRWRCLSGTYGSFAIATALLLTSQPARSASQPLDIRPAAEAPWGGRSQDVEKVLRSAAEALWPYFPERILKPILVEPKGGPITLYRRGPDGEYLMRLNTGNRAWAQHAYQFAHEFTHILANYDQNERRNKWFEESVCETASLFVLRRMSETWKVQPPYPNWKDYAPSLARYADERIRAGQLPPGKTLAGWYRENEPLLQRDACNWDKNVVVAAALLSLFEHQPKSWETIGWLNDCEPHGTRPFAAHLGDWHARVPARHRPFVRQVAGEFGIRIEGKKPDSLHRRPRD